MQRKLRPTAVRSSPSGAIQQLIMLTMGHSRGVELYFLLMAT